ncbi:cysteine and glycine-rich protein 1-like [Panonychus citri]|uniref:cysteine and glycine-rich protein 1-like n=1 Tax=Panonychus citri TaxID=50023 RepID=UPI0023080E5F|nr:cysteine and glycine-rich protein 1-like [Panonychus citri]
MPGICHRCEKTVYFNEERMAIGKSFHKTCFVCANKGCGRRLDSGNLTEHNADVYCRSCYGKLFGPKGYGYGLGAGVMNTEGGSAKIVNAPTVKPIGETVVVKTSSSISSSASPSPVNSVSSTPSPQPPSSLGASSNSTPVSSGTCSPTSDEAISLESDKCETSLSPNGSTLASDDSTTNVTPPPLPNTTATIITTPITFTVLQGHKLILLLIIVNSFNRAWHKTSCFNCKECHKRLESTTLCEKEHEIYCKTCYRKNWGPKGYGYGVTALQSCK